MNTKFNSEPVYGDNDKYIKTKITIYYNNVNTNFRGQNVLKENASYKCFSLIMLDSVMKVKKKYYPQTMLEEFKYQTRKTEIENLATDELDLSSSDDEVDSDPENESDNEPEKPSKKFDNESDKK